MKLQLDGRTFASTSTSTLLTLSPSSIGTCNHVLWASQAGTPFHMFSREALPLGNFPTRYSGARCPSPTLQIRAATATLGDQPFAPAPCPKPAPWLAYAPGCSLPYSTPLPSGLSRFCCSCTSPSCRIDPCSVRAWTHLCARWLKSIRLIKGTPLSRGDSQDLPMINFRSCLLASRAV